MELIDYPNYNEKLYVQKLANGLTVYLQPKAGFNKTTAVLGVNYGSIDSEFMLNGEKVVQPAGIAHFLEHKMFDKKDYDVFELFNKTGARSNAFTSFTKTNYLFSTAESVKENLDILLDFVQIPYFTQQKLNVKKGLLIKKLICIKMIRIIRHILRQLPICTRILFCPTILQGTFLRLIRSPLKMLNLHITHFIVPKI